MDTPFHKFADAYPKAIDSIATCLKDTHLSKLEEIALRFVHALEEGSLDLKEGNERAFLCAVLVKATNEIFGMVGALRNGALLPSYYHARSVLELFASLEHVYCNPPKKQRKLEKFLEYPLLAKYLHYQSWKQQVEAGETSEEQFKKHCPMTETEFQNIVKRLPEWQRIWNLNGADPEVVQHWHYSSDIKGLFSSSEMTKEWWGSYELISHATHLSPLGITITGGHYLIGFPSDTNGYDYKLINRPISYCIFGAHLIAVSLCHTVKSGMIEGVLNLNMNDFL
jgi:Family of unknown function (DUF5677)